jgi:hypothetical protein
MNLWGNRLGQLLTIAVALFFFSCEDEKSLLGYRNPNSKFKSYTVEINLESSVMLLDSVKSSNGAFTSEADRLLVGEFTDELGKISSTGITQYYSFSRDTIWSDAQLDSVKLLLVYDGYYYGDRAQTPINFTVNKVETKLDYFQKRSYISRTEVELGEEIGSVTTDIIPDSLSGKNYDTLFIPLSESFSAELWKVVTDFKENKNDIYSSLDKFTDEFKGIALKGDASKNIAVGFKPFSTVLVMYYHSPKKNNLVVTFKARNEGSSGSTTLVSYSNIQADRSASPLAGLTGYMNEFKPVDDQRYIQAGTGIVTKLNFDNFYHFVDTLTTDVIINEAQLLITDVATNPDGESLPQGFAVRFLKPDPYQLWTQWHIYPRHHVDSLKLARYSGFLVRDISTANGATIIPPIVDNTYVATMTDDNGNKVLMKYSPSRNRYVGYPTLYFQQAIVEANRNFREFNNAIIYPLVERGSASNSTATYDGTAASKAINKAVFPASSFKLVIKYTKPTVQE